MNVYEVNKQAYQQLPDMTEKELYRAEEKLRGWLQDYKEANYFTMLNHELRYFTVFTYGKDKHVPWPMANAIMEIVKTLGHIKGVEITDHGMVEFWVKREDECFMYALFPYDRGVIEV